MKNIKNMNTKKTQNVIKYGFFVGKTVARFGVPNLFHGQLNLFVVASDGGGGLDSYRNAHVSNVVDSGFESFSFFRYLVSKLSFDLCARAIG